jgi:regulation of enolase protein 1 (concanavalin A-like superfamily)
VILILSTLKKNYIAGMSRLYRNLGSLDLSSTPMFFPSKTPQGLKKSRDRGQIKERKKETERRRNRMKKIVSITMVILVVMSISMLTFNIQPASACGQLKANVPFSDNFNRKVLNPRWNVIDPAGGSTFSLTAHRGWLRITTTSPPDRDLLGTINVNAPRILQTLSSDFIIETKISSIMNENDEGAGLLVWKDSANYLRLDRMSRTIGGPVEQQIFFCGTIGGNFPIPGETKIVLQSSVNPTYLKLVKRGNVFSGYYSSNGILWHHVADVTFAMGNQLQVGIDIITAYHSGTFFADFDYFRITVRR